MYKAEFELETELNGLMEVLAKSDLQSEAESEIPATPQRQPGAVELTCVPPVVLNQFRSGEYTLRPHHYSRLLGIGLGVAPIIVIRGHTDNRGNAVMNTGLSLSRAFEAWQWLEKLNGGHDITAQSPLFPPTLSGVIVEAIGAAQPVASNATEAGRSANRRVEIFLCQSPPPPPQIANAVRVQMRRSIG